MTQWNRKLVQGQAVYPITYKCRANEISLHPRSSKGHKKIEQNKEKKRVFQRIKEYAAENDLMPNLSHYLTNSLEFRLGQGGFTPVQILLHRPSLGSHLERLGLSVEAGRKVPFWCRLGEGHGCCYRGGPKHCPVHFPKELLPPGHRRKTTMAGGRKVKNPLSRWEWHICEIHTER